MGLGPARRHGMDGDVVGSWVLFDSVREVSVGGNHRRWKGDLPNGAAKSAGRGTC